MSIQDDIFDIDDAMERKEMKDVAEAWDRVRAWACHMEQAIEILHKEVAELKESVVKLVKKFS